MKTNNIILENVLKNSEDHTTKMLVQCCVCQRYELDRDIYGDRVYSAIPIERLEEDQPYVISHSYCPICAEKEMKHLKM